MRQDFEGRIGPRIASCERGHILVSPKRGASSILSVQGTGCGTPPPSRGSVPVRGPWRCSGPAPGGRRRRQLPAPPKYPRRGHRGRIGPTRGRSRGSSGRRSPGSSRRVWKASSPCPTSATASPGRSRDPAHGSLESAGAASRDPRLPYPGYHAERYRVDDVSQACRHWGGRATGSGTLRAPPS